MFVQSYIFNVTYFVYPRVLMDRNYLFSNNRWPAMMSICFSGNLPYYVIQFNLIYVYAYMANKMMMMISDIFVNGNSNCNGNYFRQLTVTITVTEIILRTVTE